jgi:hypothetical protein
MKSQAAAPPNPLNNKESRQGSVCNESAFTRKSTPTPYLCGRSLSLPSLACQHLILFFLSNHRTGSACRNSLQCCAASQIIALRFISLADCCLRFHLLGGGIYEVHSPGSAEIGRDLCGGCAILAFCSAQTCSSASCDLRGCCGLGRHHVCAPEWRFA